MLIHDLVHDASVLLELEPEELAGILLEHLNTLVPGDQNLNWHNFFHQPATTFQGFDSRYHEPLQLAFAEAWAWLVREALLIPDPMRGREWFLMSRRGAKLRTKSDADAYRRASLLPRAQLHPELAQTVSATFLRGDYDTAVFQAFKLLEIAVRRAAEMSSEDFGVALMRRAFAKESGPLTDLGQMETEREALAHLFAGAIGHCKNPTSHRSVALNAVSAMELIVLASHLVKIVDARLEARERAKLASAFTRFDLNVVDYVEENESSIRSIAFNGRVIAECTTFDSEDNPYTHAVCYLTAGRKLVLTLMETGDNTIYHLATYDNLAAFADDPQFLESFPDSDRVRFLNKIREVTNQEWAKWIE